MVWFTGKLTKSLKLSDFRSGLVYRKANKVIEVVSDNFNDFVSFPVNQTTPEEDSTLSIPCKMWPKMCTKCI